MEPTLTSAAEEAAKQHRILELRGRLSSIRKKKSIVDGDDSTSTSSATTDTEDTLHHSPPLNVNSTTTSPTVDDGSDVASDDGSTDSTMSTGSAASSIMSSGSGYDPDSFMSINQGSLDDSFKELIPSDDQDKEKPKGLLDSFLETNHRDSSRSSGGCEKENRRDCSSKDDNQVDASDICSKEQTKSKRWEEKSKELRQLRIAKMKERNKQKAAAAQVNQQQPQADKPSPPSRPCVNNNNNNAAPFVSKIHKYKKLMSGTDLYSEKIRREAQRVLAQVKISHLVNEAKRIIQEADQQKAMKILLQGGDSNQVSNSTLLTTIHPNMLPPCLYDTEVDDIGDQADALYYQDDALTAVSDEAVAPQEEHMVSNEEAALSTKRKHDTLETIAHIRRQCSLEEVQFEVEMILHAVEDILKSRKGRIAWMKRKRLLSVHEDKDTELKMQVKHLKSTLKSTIQDEKAPEDYHLDDTLNIMSDNNDMDVYEDDDNSFLAIGRDGILCGSLLDYDADDKVQSKKKMRIKNPSWTKIRRMRRKSEVSKATSTTTEGTVEMDDSSRSETQELDWFVLNSAEC